MKTTSLLCLVLIALTLLQCGADEDVRGKARAAVAQQTASTTGQAPKIIENNPQPAGLDHTVPTVNANITLKMPSVEAASGSSVCLPVSTVGFTNLIGMQYTTRWDPALLAFEKINNMRLPDLTLNNFGTTHAKERGIIGISWINNSLQGVNYAADTPMYEVCFTVKAPAGTDIPVRFEGKPVLFEFIDVNEGILQYTTLNGSIKVK